MKKLIDGGRERIRLETWGEIANHLGVEIRTAQRWEDRLGLPVRRLHGSQAVSAFVDDLDAWRERRENVAAPSRPRHDGRPRSHHVLRVAAAVVVVAAAVLYAMGVRRPVASSPIALALEGNDLLALDAAGSVTWRHTFAARPRIVDSSWRRELADWWSRIDVDGDGTDEFTAVLRHVGGNDAFVETLYCFSLDGRLRYSYTPQLTLSFAQGQYSGPWSFFDVEPVFQDRSLWVSIVQEPWWASAVFRVDGSGRGSLRYVQPGNVRVLRTLRRDTEFVLAAGVNNEFAAASLALLDPRQESASAPSRGTDRFRCLNCPTAGPLKYVLLGPSQVNGADGMPYNRVEDVALHHNEIRLSTYEAERVNILYHLTDALDVTSVWLSDGYWSWQPRRGAGQFTLSDPASVLLRTWSAGVWSGAELRVSRGGDITRAAQ